MTERASNPVLCGQTHVRLLACRRSNLVRTDLEIGDGVDDQRLQIDEDAVVSRTNFVFGPALGACIIETNRIDVTLEGSIE